MSDWVQVKSKKQEAFDKKKKVEEAQKRTLRNQEQLEKQEASFWDDAPTSQVYADVQAEAPAKASETKIKKKVVEVKKTKAQAQKEARTVIIPQETTEIANSAIHRTPEEEEAEKQRVIKLQQYKERRRRKLKEMESKQRQQGKVSLEDAAAEITESEATRFVETVTAKYPNQPAIQVQDVIGLISQHIQKVTYDYSDMFSYNDLEGPLQCIDPAVVEVLTTWIASVAAEHIEAPLQVLFMIIKSLYSEENGRQRADALVHSMSGADSLSLKITLQLLIRGSTAVAVPHSKAVAFINALYNKFVGTAQTNGLLNSGNKKSNDALENLIWLLSQTAALNAALALNEAWRKILAPCAFPELVQAQQKGQLAVATVQLKPYDVLKVLHAVPDMIALSNACARTRIPADFLLKFLDQTAKQAKTNPAVQQVVESTIEQTVFARMETAYKYFVPLLNELMSNKAQKQVLATLIKLLALPETRESCISSWVACSASAMKQTSMLVNILLCTADANMAIPTTLLSEDVVAQLPDLQSRVARAAGDILQTATNMVPSSSASTSSKLKQQNISAKQLAKLQGQLSNVAPQATTSQSGGISSGVVLASLIALAAAGFYYYASILKQ